MRAIDADELRSQIRHMQRTVNPDLVQYSLVQAIIANMPTLTPPNEPLTIEQLREMDKITPVWWTWNGCWCLCERGYITTPNGDVYGADEMNGLFYRRPLEGEV